MKENILNEKCFLENVFLENKIIVSYFLIFGKQANIRPRIFMINLEKNYRGWEKVPCGPQEWLRWNGQKV